jgi:hypothetical protein
MCPRHDEALSRHEPRRRKRKTAAKRGRRRGLRLGPAAQQQDIGLIEIGPKPGGRNQEVFHRKLRPVMGGDDLADMALPQHRNGRGEGLRIEARAAPKRHPAQPLGDLRVHALMRADFGS